MIKGIVKLGSIIFVMICFTGCLTDSPCADAVQLPLPVLNISVLSHNGKSKFKVNADSNYYNPDSLALYLQNIGDAYKIDFTRPFATGNDSIIRTDKWTLLNYFYPKGNYMYIQYNKNTIDTLLIKYTASTVNCSNTTYTNFDLREVDLVDTVKIDPVKNIYTIIH